MNKIELEEENKVLKEKLGMLETINFKYINKGGAVKMISWGDDYKEWDIKNQLEYAEALASAMNEACEVIQNERDEWKEKCDSLTKTLEAAQDAIDNQRNNNINSITKANADKQEMIKTIRQLEKKLEFANSIAFDQR